jgi:hypothetical protein
MNGHSFWKDVAGEATDPLEWKHLYNLVSIARRHVVSSSIPNERVQAHACARALCLLRGELER